MARKKISTTIYLEAGQLAALQECSARTDVPMSVLIRRGVDRVLAETALNVSPLAILAPETFAAFTPVERIALAKRLGLLEGQP